jgi:hypothetical protein
MRSEPLLRRILLLSRLHRLLSESALPHPPQGPRPAGLQFHSSPHKRAVVLRMRVSPWVALLLRFENTYREGKGVSTTRESKRPTCSQCNKTIHGSTPRSSSAHTDILSPTIPASSVSTLPRKRWRPNQNSLSGLLKRETSPSSCPIS